MKCKRCFNEVSSSELICSTCGRFIDSVQSVPVGGMKELRSKVLAVVARQATVNPSLRQLCDLTMQTHRITEAEVQAQVSNDGGVILPSVSVVSQPTTAGPRPEQYAAALNADWMASDQLLHLRDALRTIGENSHADLSKLRSDLAKIATEFDSTLASLQTEFLS